MSMTSESGHLLVLVNQNEAVGNYLSERYSYRNFIIARERTLYSIYLDEEHRAQQEPLYRAIFTKDAAKWVDTFAEDISEMTQAIFNVRCPGITFQAADVPTYRRAAVAALKALGVFSLFSRF